MKKDIIALVGCCGLPADRRARQARQPQGWLCFLYCLPVGKLDMSQPQGWQCFCLCLPVGKPSASEGCIEHAKRADPCIRRMHRQTPQGFGGKILDIETLLRISYVAFGLRVRAGSLRGWMYLAPLASCLLGLAVVWLGLLCSLCYLELDLAGAGLRVRARRGVLVGVSQRQSNIYRNMNQELVEGQIVDCVYTTPYFSGHGYKRILTPREFDKSLARAWCCSLIKQYKNNSDVIAFCRERVRHYAVGRYLANMQARRSAYRFDMKPRKPFLQRLHDARLAPATFRYDRAVGIELETVRPASVSAPVLPYWARAVGDGSIETNGVRGVGVEYNVLCVRRELEHRLFKLCGLLVGHVVNKSCGLHIHLDCRGKTSDEVWQLARRVDKWLFALRELVPESRRDNRYAKFGASKTDRYRAVNFTAFREHGTLEVRLHSGTVDYTKVISWIRLLELLLVVSSKPKSGASCLQVLAQLPLTDYERSYWLQRHRQLNPSLYPSAVPSTEIE